MKDYEEAKKAAIKSKDKSDTAQAAVKHTVKIRQESLKTQQDANDWKENIPRAKKGTQKPLKKRPIGETGGRGLCSSLREE